ncbi:MAG: hypothetical protein E7439_06265 [Ruminococcaceae bacterium]|nr:hypothetical protein [Oscillospiraceae bacterium]
MKRTVYIMTILLLLLSALATSASSTDSKDTNDSTHIPRSFKDLYDSQDATIIRVYSSGYYAFRTDSHTRVEELVDNRPTEGYIVCYNNGEFDCYYNTILVNGQYHKITPETSISKSALNIYLQNDLSSLLGRSTTIQEKYFLHQFDSDEYIIVFCTNIGYFVYFENGEIPPCIFSADAFQSYVKLVKEVNDASFLSTSSSSFRYDICDLSAYTLGSPKFNPNINTIPWVPENLIVYVCIGITLLVVAAVVIPVVIYRKKYKDVESYEEPKSTRFDEDFLICHNIENHTAVNEPMPPAPH